MAKRAIITDTLSRITKVTIGGTELSNPTRTRVVSNHTEGTGKSQEAHDHLKTDALKADFRFYVGSRNAHVAHAWEGKVRTLVVEITPAGAVTIAGKQVVPAG